MKKDKAKLFAGYLILVVVGVVTSLLGISVSKRFTMTGLEKPSLYPDWHAIKGRNPDKNIKVAKITSGCPSDGCVTPYPATVEFSAIRKRYFVRGKMSRAYLYIEAMVDYDRPLTVWDDFYFKINGFGGHLINDYSLLPVPPGDTSRFLYDFRSISYFPSIMDKERSKNRKININLFNLLQNGITLDVTATVSSDRPGRNMREVSIYYECFEGSDCSIEEKK